MARQKPVRFGGAARTVPHFRWRSIRAQASLPFGRKARAQLGQASTHGGALPQLESPVGGGRGPGKGSGVHVSVGKGIPESSSLLPDRVIPIRLTATEDVATPFALSVPACGDRPPPAARRPPPPCRKAERNREPATVLQKVSEDWVKCSRNFMTKLLGFRTRQSKHQSFR